MPVGPQSRRVGFSGGPPQLGAQPAARHYPAGHRHWPVIPACACHVPGGAHLVEEAGRPGLPPMPASDQRVLGSARASPARWRPVIGRTFMEPDPFETVQATIFFTAQGFDLAASSTRAAATSASSLLGPCPRGAPQCTAGLNSHGFPVGALAGDRTGTRVASAGAANVSGLGSLSSGTLKDMALRMWRFVKASVMVMVHIISRINMHRLSLMSAWQDWWHWLYSQSLAKMRPMPAPSSPSSPISPDAFRAGGSTFGEGPDVVSPAAPEEEERAGAAPVHAPDGPHSARAHARSRAESSALIHESCLEDSIAPQGRAALLLPASRLRRRSAPCATIRPNGVHPNRASALMEPSLPTNGQPQIEGARSRSAGMPKKKDGKGMVEEPRLKHDFLRRSKPRLRVRSNSPSPEPEMPVRHRRSRSGSAGPAGMTSPK
ncbi:hypothetical protein CYMTET_20345 [Cymbomonas tetramitiformis]|uniref:Uncharacterized protein n=1 Tax=Cymbomonas tetramitiformis TaxID=36881 RepID=A0AAE0G486_9CHLO|nr:hypothetical protein CYMTET_20345 [Cymbomonas tetramitiformis]